MKLRRSGQPDEFDVELDAAHVRINGNELTATLAPLAAGVTVIRLGQRAVRTYTARRRDSILVAVGPAQFEFFPLEQHSARRSHGLLTPEITAPMPGKVVKLLVAEGQQVGIGEPLVVLEAMKMETAIHAESRALVKRIRVSVGEMVDHGAVLLELSPVPPQAREDAPPVR